MSNCIIFSMPGNEELSHSLIKLLHAEMGESIIRHCANGETYVKVLSDVHEKEALIICSLHKPDDKILPLYFLAKTLKESGAYPITLTVPYMAYMHQNKSLAEGECASSGYLGELLSFFVDKLITVEPHLSFHGSANEIYSIHTSVLQVSNLVSNWINKNIRQPLLVGWDSESEQWVSKLAADINAPCIMPGENRIAARKRKITVPYIEKYKEYTPVLVNDIISTDQTMIETIRQLKKADMKPPVCIGVHAVFAAKAYEKLLRAGAEKIVTCNTIAHPSNDIYIDELLAQEICKNSFVVY